MNIENDKLKYQMKFENLRKIRDLKNGPNGIVSLYEDPSNSQNIVIKTLYYSDINDQEVEKAFQNEINAIIELKHRCILPIYGYSLPVPSTQNSLAIPPKIGTIYAENGSLADILNLIEKGTKPSFVDDTWIATTIIGIILGMKHIHSKKWIYRDLKPSNILIDKRGYPLIGDFGSSRFADLNITYTKMVGSPHYMAPEMYDEGRYTNMVDSYSFALILYELLVGKPVFEKNIQPLPLMRKVCNGTRPEIPNSIRPEIRDIISKCWDVSPDQRLRFNDIFVALKRINFQITPNVDVEKVKKFIDEVSNKINIKICLLNGEIYPLEVTTDEEIRNIRKKVSEYTHIPLPYTILTIKGKKLCCCWTHTLSEGTTIEDVMNCWKDEFLRDLTFDLCYAIHAEYLSCDPCYSPLKTETYFFMLPGTINDMFKEITNITRNLWYLNGCNMKIKYNDEIIVPSNETMLEKGIESGAYLEIYNNYDKLVNINGTIIECNLDDPVSDLIWRYLHIKRITINKFPFLEKDGIRINESSSLRLAGINENDRLNLKFIESNIAKDVCINFTYSKKMYIPPNETLGSLKRNIILATHSVEPIGTLKFPPFPYSDDDQISQCENLMQSNKICIQKIMCYNKYEDVRY